MSRENFSVCIKLNRNTLQQTGVFISRNGSSYPEVISSSEIEVVMLTRTEHSPQYALELLRDDCYEKLPGAIKTVEEYMTKNFKYSFGE